MTTVEFFAGWMIRSSILIASGALLLWLLRVKDSSIRAAAWTAMLCGSFLIPAVTAAFPTTFLPTVRKTAAGVVIRPAEVPPPVTVSRSTPSAPALAATPAPIAPAPQYNLQTARPEPPASHPATNPFDWPRAALIFYAATCGAMLLRICAGLLVGLRLLRRSGATGQARDRVAIRESGDITAPLTLGVLRPSIVLPLDWREWDNTKLEAVLAHERSHIERRDPWVQLLSGLHRAILWASPLSWFLHQRILQTAEEASDDAAVAATRDQVLYAETLLDFMQRGVWKTGFVGISMARHGSPEKRIRRILNSPVLNSNVLSRGVTGRSVAAIVAVVSPLAYVIATAQARPQFDIADVHVSAPRTGAIPLGPAPMTYGGAMRGGMYQLPNAPMLGLIGAAYGVDAGKILGGPSWLELDRYDVFAKGPDRTSADAARLMLQSLLAERFKLVLHRDTRPLPGFALKVEKGGSPKLKKADGSGSSGCKGAPQFSDKELGARRDALVQEGHANQLIVQTYLYTCQNVTMAAFAAAMRGTIDTQRDLGTGAVADQTGLSGAWDFNFKYTSHPVAPASEIDGEVITIFDAIEKQLGLKLEAAKIPTPVLVVDSVNRKPADNPPDVKTILPPPPPAAFEAATLRLSDPNAPEVRSRGPMPGGRFEVQNFGLRQLINLGWGITGMDLTGAPAWLNSARVDITAKLPSTGETREIGGVADFDAFVPALKALLIERFKVAIHTEQKPVPGYALVAAKPKMRKADPSLRTKCFEGPGADGPGSDKKDPRVSNPLLSRLVTCQNITMPEFAERLAGLSGADLRNQLVVDASGIEGAYDFTLSFSVPRTGALGGPPEIPEGGLTIFDALDKQLGLKLEKRNIPAPVVILDRIEQKPTEN